MNFYYHYFWIKYCNLKKQASIDCSHNHYNIFKIKSKATESTRIHHSTNPTRENLSNQQNVKFKTQIISHHLLAFLLSAKNTASTQSNHLPYKKIKHRSFVGKYRHYRRGWPTIYSCWAISRRVPCGRGEKKMPPGSPSTCGAVNGAGPVLFWGRPGFGFSSSVYPPEVQGKFTLGSASQEGFFGDGFFL